AYSSLHPLPSQPFIRYRPNSPNPTGGRLTLVPGDRLHDLDMSVGRGIRLLVTTGMGDDQAAVKPLAADDRRMENSMPLSPR
ncbi:MAG: hypothetical protein ABEH65_05310, partial [Halobacteriales archaeon]